MPQKQKVSEYDQVYHNHALHTSPPHREEEQQNIYNYNKTSNTGTVLPANSDSDFMFCLQGYQGLIIDRSLLY